MRHSISSSTVSIRAPENPFASAFARSSIAARTISGGYGSPTPQAWLRSSRSWSSSTWSAEIDSRDEATEARVDAVGVLGRLVDERPRRLHLTARLVGEADGRAVHGYLPDVLQPQVVPVQRVTQNHAASLDPGQ